MFNITNEQEKEVLKKIIKEQKQCIKKLNNRIEELEYELICLDGLYVTDKYESAIKINDDCWVLNLKEIINKGLD